MFVNADATRIAQVVTNLISNAAKFTPTGGTATISVAGDHEGSAILRVVDSGIGVDPAFMPRLFEPFVQGDRTLDRARGGLGLGLSLVKGLVDLHGGEIRARSAGAGTGTEFTIRLPWRLRLRSPVPLPTWAGRRGVACCDRRRSRRPSRSYKSRCRSTITRWRSRARDPRASRRHTNSSPTWCSAISGCPG